MSGSLRIDFAYPGDLSAPTGGYGYDRRVIAELRALGCSVRTIALPASFPYPTDDDLAQASRLLSAGERDALIIDGLAFGALPAELVRALEPRPIALTHHPLFLETGLAAQTAALLRAREQAAIDEAAAVVTTSDMTADIVAREFSVSRARLFAAAPGVEPAARAPGSTDSVVRLFSVGSLTPRKGYSDLVRALARVGGDWRLSIAGSHDLAPDCAREVAALIENSGLGDRIALLGACDADEVAGGYAASDAFVTASHFEGFGMAIAEAIARGLPIVATKEVASAGAAPEEATLAYPAGDVAALAALLRRLVDDRSLRRALSDAAWRAAAAQARWSDTARLVLRAARFAMTENAR